MKIENIQCSKESKLLVVIFLYCIVKSRRQRQNLSVMNAGGQMGQRQYYIILVSISESTPSPSPSCDLGCSASHMNPSSVNHHCHRFLESLTL